MPDQRRPVAQLRQRVVESPMTAIFVFLATIYLAGLPAIYTIFGVGLDPSGGEAAAWKRPEIALFVIWIACAVLVGSLAFLRDTELQFLFDLVRTHAANFVEDRHRDAVVAAVPLLLENGRDAQLLRAFSPRVFIASPPRKPTELVPLLAKDIQTWQRWPVGTGAIGFTFKENSDEPLVFRRADLAKLNRTLTVEQLEHYEHLTMVAAIAIRDDANRPLGVLSVSSAAHSPRFGKTRQDAMKLLASNLGVFLQLMV